MGGEPAVHADVGSSREEVVVHEGRVVGADVALAAVFRRSLNRLGVRDLAGPETVDGRRTVGLGEGVDQTRRLRLVEERRTPPSIGVGIHSRCKGRWVGQDFGDRFGHGFVQSEQIHGGPRRGAAALLPIL